MIIVSEIIIWSLTLLVKCRAGDMIKVLYPGDNQPVEYTSYHNLGSNTENIKIGSSFENWALASVLGRLLL